MSKATKTLILTKSAKNKTISLVMKSILLLSIHKRSSLTTVAAKTKDFSIILEHRRNKRRKKKKPFVLATHIRRHNSRSSSQMKKDPQLCFLKASKWTLIWISKMYHQITSKRKESYQALKILMIMKVNKKIVLIVLLIIKFVMNYGRTVSSVGVLMMRLTISKWIRLIAF